MTEKVYLDDLEPDSGNITDGVTLTTESCDQDLVVLFDEVEATVVGDEGGDLLAVLDQLDTDTLSDGGVRLLGFDTDLKEKKQCSYEVDCPRCTERASHAAPNIRKHFY